MEETLNKLKEEEAKRLEDEQKKQKEEEEANRLFDEELKNQKEDEDKRLEDEKKKKRKRQPMWIQLPTMICVCFPRTDTRLRYYCYYYD